MFVTFLISLSILSGIYASDDEDYFPDKIFASRGGGPYQHIHTAESFSRLLKVLNEPSLYKLRDEKGRHTYRFLWRRSFRKADSSPSFRLDIEEDGRGVLTSKTIAFKRQPKLVRFVKTEQRTLTKQEVSEFLKKLEVCKFWEMPTKGGRHGKDGDTWLMEGVKEGKYHAVERWRACGPFRDAAAYLRDKSGLILD